jgi:hypothetical protein
MGDVGIGPRIGTVLVYGRLGWVCRTALKDEREGV